MRHPIGYSLPASAPTVALRLRALLPVFVLPWIACGGDSGAASREADDVRRPGQGDSSNSGSDTDDRDDGGPGEDVVDEDVASEPDSAAGCTPGGFRCVDNRVLACGDDGVTETVAETCAFGCAAGRCTEPCGGNEKSYLGCGFVAVDLDNSDQAVFGGAPASEQQFSVSVSNPSPEPAEITVIDAAGRLVAGPAVVASGDLVTLDLPQANADDTGLRPIGYRVISTTPVTAHQFNPRQNSGVYSNDASLLLPINALGTDYMVLGWPTEVQNIPFVGSRPLRSFVTLASAVDGATQVTISAPARTGVAAGPGFAALAAGETRTVTLQAGDVLSMIPPDVDQADLSGMRIRSDRPIAVFAGAECANVPRNVTYCDHLEEQQLPVDTWGTTYLVAKQAARGRERDLYRVVSATDGTTVFTVPAQPGAASVTLNAGQVLQFESANDFVLTATAPVTVAQFLTGSSSQLGSDPCLRDGVSDFERCAIPSESSCNVGSAGENAQPSGIGDPALMMLVPQEQFRTDYTVLTPADYLQDWLTLIVPATASVTLDGAPVTVSAQALADSGLVIYRVPVDDGVHRVTATEPMGLYAYGYDCDVSYSYAGGLNLNAR
ncbi:MAG: hypothetical protein KGO50_00850 [Myxococcales bacterium]|nr:hypothetical protein [Myxococcales bacterium]